MSLTKKIRDIVGPGGRGNGRGRTWLYVGREETTVEQKRETIQQLKSKFGGIVVDWKYGQVYVFKIGDLGSAKIQFNPTNEGGMTVIDYTNDNWDRIVVHLTLWANGVNGTMTNF